MLLPGNSKLILGSSSPRRQELLSHLGVPFQVIKPEFAEVLQAGEEPKAYVRRNAQGKAHWILDNALQALPPSNFLIIAADTIVVLDGKILEKPCDKDDAFNMLQMLSHNTHTVHTGICMLQLTADLQQSSGKTAVVTSEVSFKRLEVDEINRYIATGEPMDKAGSYAIQGKGSYMVERINGSYTNVMGLPLTETYEWLRSLD